MSTQIKSYQDAKEFLGNKSERPYAHNTRIRWNPLGHDNIEVKYHDSIVTTFYPDCTSFSSGGWRTSTTKERLNWFLPDGFGIYQKGGVWYLHQQYYKFENPQTWIFADGIVIDNFNNVSNAEAESKTDEIKALTKQINKYAKEYAHALVDGKVESPSSGDCWYCLLQTNDGQSMGEAFNDTGHLESHFDESYFVPSLLINAVKQYPMSKFSNGTMYQLWESGETIGDWQKDILERDVKSSITKYLKKQFQVAN